MLIGSARRRLLALVVAAATLVSVTFLATSSASADVVQVCNASGTCWWKVVTPGQGSFPGMPGGGGGGPRMCLVPANEATTVQPPGLPVPCYDPAFGYLDNIGCYHRRLDPQPPASDPVWRGNYPNGAIWWMSCPWANFGGGNTGAVWREAPPPQAGAMPSAYDLAVAAIAELIMVAPIIGIVPEPGGTGLVGLPVWMWSQDPGRTFTPDWATAAVPGLAVRADSTHPKAGTYTISATTTWEITWRTIPPSDQGDTFTYSLTTTLPTPIVINELQVVTK
jgi:hypothetical protein